MTKTIEQPIEQKPEVKVTCETFQVTKITMTDQDGKVGVNYFTQNNVSFAQAQQIIGEIMVASAKQQALNESKTVVSKGS